VRNDLQAARAHWPLGVADKTAVNAGLSIDVLPLSVKLWPETDQRNRANCSEASRGKATSE
jgi:hypothetical protein